MPYDETMVNRVREIIADRTDKVEERAMFGGLAFLVDDKLCVAVKTDKIFARLAPEVYEAVVDKEGISLMKRGNTAMKGYVYIDFDMLQNQTQLERWVGSALDFNPLAERSARR
ncbi:TfoX/Sxy family protein [Mucilaginibacter myungsuensis]|uniref:TfoX/Sxy family protein n=1 Tax=Mucilaginibacter myungsuensis TaxID=649104 RepID=A0A929KVK4_9SPHI|nr:TfoX/Sxy family protein [Mucilaginibacter myungsuensis]MBE9661255.1 TfoX/Sxy family protein [Mucilaginibacter myungsuensis]MDN3597398.1 TfoX/Sxy family protein [Mucilaginibacter myungsuensis]